MSPHSTTPTASRYKCRYPSCQTTCARRADMKRHEVQRHQSSKVFCPQLECKFRGTTRPAVIRRHFEHRHPRLSDKDVENFLVDKFSGEAKSSGPVVTGDDTPPTPDAEHWKRSSQDSSTPESLDSITSYDGFGNSTVHYPQLPNSTSPTKISASPVSDHSQDIAFPPCSKLIGTEPMLCNVRLAWNVPQPPYANYILDQTACFNQTPSPSSDPVAHNFLTFVEGLWRASPTFLQPPDLEYLRAFN